MLKYISLGFFLLAVAAFVGYVYLDKPIKPTFKNIPDQLQRTGHLSIEVIRQPFFTPLDTGRQRNVLIRNGRFEDSLGRQMLLKGVNLGNVSKLPAKPYLPTHKADTSRSHPSTYSFVGHPLPLAEADRHMERIRASGFHLLRLLVTWEAVSPKAPYRYDEAYLNYLEKLVEIAADYNLSVLIDLHQDSWSRYCGGSGAPFWTHEAIGMDYERIDSVAAAFTHTQALALQTHFVWDENYHRYGSATMFTLFFAGDVFAPSLKVGGKSSKTFLQGAYIAMAATLAKRLGRFPNVIGIEAMNQPDPGFIGENDLNSSPRFLSGPVYTPIEGMALAGGRSLKKPMAKSIDGRLSLTDSAWLNPNRHNLWKQGLELWRSQGVYDVETTGAISLKKPDYFSKHAGNPFSFMDDAYLPFLERLSLAIDTAYKGLPLWVHLPNGQKAAKLADLPNAGANLLHWNDQRTSRRSRFNPYVLRKSDKEAFAWGKQNINKFWQSQLEAGKEKAILPGRPAFVAATGLPFNLNHGRLFRETNREAPMEAFKRLFSTLEQSGLSYGFWNYSPYHSAAFGDRWNGEDYSLYSPESTDNELKGLYRGIRLHEVTLRPYPYKTNGDSLSYAFDEASATFRLSFTSGKDLALPSLIYLPEVRFGRGFTVAHTPAFLQYDALHQLLLFYPLEKNTRQYVEIRAADPLSLF